MSDNSVYEDVKFDVAELILNANSLQVKEYDVVLKDDEENAVLSDKDLRAFIKNIFSTDMPLSVAFSHDNYIEVTGGIQKCLHIEEKVFREAGGNYLHIFPIIPRTWIVPDSFKRTVLWGINYNGEYIGTVQSGTLIDVIPSHFNYEIQMIVHSPLGHCLHDILMLGNAISPKVEWFIWIHDYTTLCPSYHLLRNNVTFCNAPDIFSVQCKICVHGDDRSDYIRQFHEFFLKTNPVVLCPSDFVRRMWLEKSDYHHKDVRVVEHYQFGSALNVSAELSSATIKVAYVGTVAYHKGWNEFIDLIKIVKAETDIFSFYVFADNAPVSHLYDHKKVDLSEDNQSDMRLQLIKNGIDIAYIGSLWPETFCLTAYEAIAADVFLMANYLSGNVVEIINTTRQGKVYRGINDLFHFFLSEKFQEFIFSRRNAKRYSHLNVSKMTFAQD